MCCSCCTSVKEAATWGAVIHTCVGLLLLIRYFIIEQELGESRHLYLVYVCLITCTGMLILLGVIKDIGFLVKSSTILFIMVQIYGIVVRFIIPSYSYNERTSQRIGTGAVGALVTVLYIYILIRYSRKCSAGTGDSV